MNKSLVFPCLFLVIFYFQAKAQTIMIQGKVMASRFPVKEALVTFIDDVDTTKKFSSMTDNLGNYQIGPIPFPLQQLYRIAYKNNQILKLQFMMYSAER